MTINKEVLNKQREYWEFNFLNKPEMFGTSPSEAAIKSCNFFKNNNCKKILEIGAGQGRDSLFFLKNNFNISVLDYSQKGIDQIINKSKLYKNYKNIKAKCHDVRLKLPFKDNEFDGCFSHMLYCMAFTLDELKFVSNELLRILKPGGLNIYTVRNHNDGDYNNGKFIGENLYENDGFIVHFFSIKTINNLSKGFDILNINKFHEGKFPRKLFLVIMKKK